MKMYRDPHTFIYIPLKKIEKDLDINYAISWRNKAWTIASPNFNEAWPDPIVKSNEISEKQKGSLIKFLFTTDLARYL